MITSESFSELKAKQEVHEQRFVSRAPLVGPFIAWFRTQWNNIATRWYVLPMVQQQNDYNRILIKVLDELLQHLCVLEETVTHLDVDQVELARDLAETRYQVIRTLKDLGALVQPPRPSGS